MSKKYSSFTLAAAIAVASLGLTSYALASSGGAKPGAHNPESAQDTSRSQRQQGSMQQGAQQPQQREQVQGAPMQQQGGKQQQAGKQQQGDQTKAPVLLGVIVSVPIPAADAALPRGADYSMEIDDADEMRATLAAVTEAALNKGSHSDLVENFVDMDRNRLTDFDERSLRTLEGRIAQINKAWQQKYGQQFDIAENAVYQPLTYAEGEITDASTFIQRWPVRSGGSSGAAKSKIINERVRDQGNIEAGRGFGIARFPAEHGLPAVNVSFIDEAFGWKIDLPNDVDGQQLRTNLLQHLTAFGERADQWPASVLEAQRLASHHVAMALYGMEVPQRLSVR
jgi:hypothetical protein